MPFVGLLAYYVLTNHLFGRLDESHDNPKWLTWMMPLLVGSFGAQPILLGTWLALGTGPILVRAPVAFTSLSIAMFAIGVQRLDVFNSTRLDLGLLLGAFIAFSIVGGLGLIMRWFTSCAIVKIGPASARTPAQFSILFLLGLMAAWAVILAIANRAEIGTADDELPPIGAAVVFLFLSLATAPSLLPSLFELTDNRSYRRHWRFAVVVAVSIGLMLSIAAAMFSETRDLPGTLVPLLTGAAVCGLISANVLTYAGYRLIRRRPELNSTS